MPGDDIEELEMARARFDGLEKEMATTYQQVVELEMLAARMIALGEPTRAEELIRRKHRSPIRLCIPSNPSPILGFLPLIGI